jgi:CRP-like cAMP-binding protein
MLSQMPYAELADLAPTDTRHTLRERLLAVCGTCRPETIDAMVDTARIRSVREGENIYRQGETVPLTLILEGYGISRRTTADGHQLFSGVARSGVLFGYSGIAAAASSVEIVALTDCLVAQWRGSEIRELVKVDPAVALTAIDSMAGSLHAAMESIEGFLHQDARRRVLRILARHRSLFFGDPPVLTRTHLSGLVGTTQEMTRRALRQLEQEGTIVREGRSGLRLLRPERLDSSAA